MLHPDEFKINEAWIAFRLNEVPVTTEADGDFNVIALMDAASCFILSSEFVPATSSEPSQLEAKRLIKNAKSHKQQLPKTLYIPENQAADILCMEAERYGIAVNRVPEKQLLVMIGEARDCFKEYMGGDSVQ
ncbi:MAG: hypothetical protein PF589_11350 [Gammaproteobacteria bacterium]|jgi:hypothetical protein|nr:hypothetical protein [Gammaproteobacteria bacterium]